MMAVFHRRCKTSPDDFVDGEIDIGTDPIWGRGLDAVHDLIPSSP
jgi:hypothetical protein